MGSDHAKVVATRIPGATLQVVCDADGARAKSIAKTLGATDMWTDPEAVIARADVDAVIVASPDLAHAPLSISCIHAGKKVLCEKPLSPSSAECLDLMEAEQKAGEKFIQVGFMRRFDQSYAEMKRMLDDDTLGVP